MILVYVGAVVMGVVVGGLEALYDRSEMLVGRVSLTALAIALVLHVAKLAARARGWHNVVRAAYPSDPLPFREALGAFLVGVGVDAVVPARAGELMRVELVRRRLPDSTFPGLASTLVAEWAFDAVLTVLFVGMAIAVGFAPGQTLGTFSSGPIARHPLLVSLAVACAVLALGSLAFLLRSRVRPLLADARRGLAVFSNPSQYFRGVAAWQAVGWVLRLASVYWFLAAFGVHATLATAALVVGIQLIAASVPFTPGGAGSQQAILVVALSATATATVLGFGIGMQAATVLADIVLGLGALVRMTGFPPWRYLKLKRGPAPWADPTDSLAARERAADFA
jgi:uncharacterized membrane protein YbhN (UPF0104 family)